MTITIRLAALLAAATLTAQGQTSRGTARTLADMEPLLDRISTYQTGANPAPEIEFDELVGRLSGSAEARGRIEARLLKMLQSDATPAGKEVAFRELSLIGSDASIPVLAPMLVSIDTAEMARYALAAMPGPAVDAALRKGLGQAPSDRIKIGLINSLGHRKDAKSVPAVAAYVSPSNPELTSAAVAALANIADRPALNALAAARSNASGPVRALVSEAYVACADRFSARGEKAVAEKVYRQMIAPGEPRMIRIRALTGLAAAAGTGAVPALTAEIQSQDPDMKAVAIRLLNGIPGPKVTKVLAAEFPKLPTVAQVNLLTALANRGDASARPVVISALKSSESTVRAAALSALGKLGDQSSVAVLAEAAAAGHGPEPDAARRALYTLRGSGVDGAIIAALGSSSGKVKSELIGAAGERGTVTAADALTRAAQDSDPDLRRGALRALRNVGGAGQTQALLDLVLKSPSATDRREATQTLATVLRRAQPAPLGAVISAYKSAARPSQLSLLEVMGQTSSDEALPLLRAGMRDADPEIARAAMLALAAWDNPAPLTDLLDYAKGAHSAIEAPPLRPVQTESAGPGRGGRGGPPPTNNLQVLALRGVLKLIVLQSQRSASENGRLLGQAMGLATQNAEKIGILALLPYFPSHESLEVAQSASRDQAVANEAKVAIAQVNEALKLK